MPLCYYRSLFSMIFLLHPCTGNFLVLIIFLLLTLSSLWHTLVKMALYFSKGSELWLKLPHYTQIPTKNAKLSFGGSSTSYKRFIYCCKNDHQWCPHPEKKKSSILKLYEYNCLIQVIMRFRWVTFTILLKRWSLLLGLNCMWKRTFIYRYYNLKINTFGVGDISRKKSFLTSCENVTILVYICKSFSDVLDLHVAEAAFKLKC